MRVGTVNGEEVPVYFPPVVDSRVVEGGVASPGPAVRAHAVLPAQCEVTSLSSLSSHLMRRLRRALLFLLTAQCMGASPVRWQGVAARPGSLTSRSLTLSVSDLLRASTSPVLALLRSLSPPVSDLT